MFEPHIDRADGHADEHAADGEPGELEEAAGEGGGGALDDHFDAELKGEQAGGVVEEAFAFEQVDDALGHADAAGDGGCGHGVGGGDDGAEEEAELPVEAGEPPPGGEGDTDGGEEDEEDGEAGDGGDVVSEFAPRGLPRGDVEQGREDDQKDHRGR